jgi:Na+-transporting NADH:ubiquinone oxidoreductase subunit C
MSTIKGIVFDHKGETAGLGAEITQKWFQDRFVGEKIFNSSSKLVGINVSKSNNDPKNLDKSDHEVDAISGATITGDGVSDMLIERLNHYILFFNKYKSVNNSLAIKLHLINNLING